MDHYTPDPFSQNNGGENRSNAHNDAYGGSSEHPHSGPYADNGYHPNSGPYNNGYQQNNGPYNNGYSQNNGPYNNGYQQYNGRNPNNNYNNNYNNYGGPAAQNCPSFALWLTLGILCALFASRICGVISIIYLIMGNTAYKAGNYPQYESQFKTVRIALVIGLVLWIVLRIFRIIGGFILYTI